VDISRVLNIKGSALLLQHYSGWWFGTFGLFFHSVGNVIIPTVTHSIIFRVGRKTTNQNNISIITNHIDPP
jgi:hypothetical protein